MALLAARLCDVRPDGSVLRVSYGLLNLTHRDGHETPQPLAPGQRYRVRLKLNDVAHAFPRGHRIRLALSTCYWPIAWPAPEPVTVTVNTGSSHLELPVRPPREQDLHLRPFEAPEAAPGTDHVRLRPFKTKRSIEIDLSSNEMIYTLRSDGGEFGGASLARIEAIDLDLGYTLLKRFRIVENDPLSARAEFEQNASLSRRDWSVRVECRTKLTSNPEVFEFSVDLSAYEGEQRFARREWSLAIPRALV